MLGVEVIERLPMVERETVSDSESAAIFETAEDPKSVPPIASEDTLDGIQVCHCKHPHHRLRSEMFIVYIFLLKLVSGRVLF
jgi:hypothetical protein